MTVRVIVFSAEAAILLIAAVSAWAQAPSEG